MYWVREIHPLAEELLATDGCWEKESQFSLGMRTSTNAPVDGPTAMHIQTALSRLNGFKTRPHKVGREMWWYWGMGVLILYSYLKSPKTDEG